jgi:acyl carrier protein phosphodiesterase
MANGGLGGDHREPVWVSELVQAARELVSDVQAHGKDTNAVVVRQRVLEKLRSKIPPKFFKPKVTLEDVRRMQREYPDMPKLQSILESWVEQFEQIQHLREALREVDEALSEVRGRFGQ